MQHRDKHDESRQHGSGAEESGVALLVFFVIVLASASLYIANKRYHVRPAQLIEGTLYLVCIAGAVWVTVHYLWTFKKKQEQAWPKLPTYVSPRKDQSHVEDAFRKNAIVLGYEREQPVLWTDEVRRMQGILLGAPGSGKTTVLRNIIVQDIHRIAGGEANPHRIPMIIFDGKGDGGFLDSLLFEIAAAGRLHQLRVLDPTRPDISVRYNPLYVPEGDSYQEHATLTFESFGLTDDFFKFHQANYFNNLFRVLAHTGKRINLYDVLVAALDEPVLKEQIAEAAYRIEHLSDVRVQDKLNFGMSVRDLEQSFQDRERVTKIQGLINELMVFVEDDLSVVTGSYDNLLTLDEVIDQELILFVSLNTNRNPRAVTALGRMLLQNLQLMVGKRYSNRDRLREGLPMVSIILDEFEPFAYPNFARVLQTARGSNVSFLFSLQSIAQLESVGRGFRNNVTSAPNTLMLMKMIDEETAKYFQNAASQVPVERRTERVHRRSLFSETYEKTGWANVTDMKEPRVPDEHIKNLPIGQMQLLMTDSRMGAPRYSHLHARRAPDSRPQFFEPTIYPPIEPARSRSNGANLRFRDSSLARRYARIAGRRNREAVP
ncbi:MAG: type IV secretory system conjugative DNA transfer family protein [Candidatus Angelobacter sp.]